MGYLAKKMNTEMNIPFKKISFFGQIDTINSLRTIAEFFGDKQIIDAAEDLIIDEKNKFSLMIEKYVDGIKNKKIGIYVGGAFKAKSLIKAFGNLGAQVIFVGTQTGNKEDYDEISNLCNKGTIIADDTNPSELIKFLVELEVDLLVGEVKERFLAHKLGIGFCDHNHERKIPLAGFVGDFEFTREIYTSLNSPILKIIKNQREVI